MGDGSLRGVLPSDHVQTTKDLESGKNRIVNVGDIAPDFQLPAVVAGVKTTVRLADYRGKKNVVLAFYPFNWQETSARQMTGYQAHRERVQAVGTEIVAITVDSIMNITAWERYIGPIDCPLCSDFWPHGEVSARYGVLQDGGAEAGASRRAIFVIDRAGRVAFQKMYAQNSVPAIEDLVGSIEDLS